MSFRYICRCCGMKMAEFDHRSVSESQLGLDSLTPDERQHIISREPDGTIVVRILCEYCRDAFRQHPELSLIGNPLQ